MGQVTESFMWCSTYLGFSDEVTEDDPEKIHPFLVESL